MRVKLTDAVVKSLPVDGKDRIVFDTAETGFGVRITPAGAKIFIAQCRVGGVSRRVPIGRFPATSVAAARSDARAMVTDMRAGHDPRAAKAQRQVERAGEATTVSQLADDWLSQHIRLKRKPRTIADYEQIVEKTIKPEFGARAVKAVTRREIAALHVRLAMTPRRANYIVAVIRSMFTFAERMELRPQGTNPAKGIEAYRERARDRFLDAKELSLAAELISAAEQAEKIGPHIAAGLRLCLFTGCRSGEATAMEWSHVDLKAKVVRLPDSKSNRPRIIHLNGPALETLKRLDRIGKYVVAGAKPDEPAKNLRAAWGKIKGKTALAGVRLHDLRHSFASAAVEKGLSLPMIGKLLGHTVPATTARYAHLAQDPVAAANELVAGVYEDAAASAAKPRGKVVRLPVRKGAKR